MPRHRALILPLRKDYVKTNGWRNAQKYIPALLLCLFAFLLPQEARAQGGILTGGIVVISSSGHPVAGATVTVCQLTDNGVPCTNTVSLFSDPALTIATANPGVTDGNGNFVAFASPGNYHYTVTGNGVKTTGQPFTTTAALVSGGCFSSLNGVSYVGGSCASSWGGGDIGAQINTAYTALPSTGGKIVIVSQTNGACYSYSTPILLNTQGKQAILQGASGTSNANGDVDGGACLNYTPNTATTAITIGWGPVTGGGYAPGGGFRDLTLKANGGCFAPGGCGNLATSVLTTNGGAHHGFFQNVKIEGFGQAWRFNDNSDGWGLLWSQFSIVNNTHGVLVSSTLGEEKLVWDGGSCAVNGDCIVNLQPATDFYLHGVSIDSNTTSPMINNGATMTFSDCHFENLGQSNIQYITSGNAVTILGGLVLNDAVSGTPAGQFFTTTTGFFSMYGTSVYSPNQAITSILNNTAAGGGNISVTTLTPGNISAICSNIQNCIGGIQSGNNPPYQIPVLKFPEGTSVTGAGNYTVCGANSTTHIWECNYGSSGTFQMAQTIASSLISSPAVLGTSAIASGACASTVTVTATGVNINDAVQWVPNGDTSTLAGYGANAAGHLDITAWPSTNAVNFKVCNSTGGSLTPHSLQLNWAVTRW